MTDLLELMSTGERNISQLADPVALRDAASRVLEFAHARGVTSLLAASPAAERIVGAALVARPEGVLEVTTTDGALGPITLVVDVNLASGTALAHAARRARRAGAGQVLAAVLHQLTQTSPAARDCLVDELVVLEESPQR